MAEEFTDFDFPGDPSKYPTTRELPLGDLDLTIKSIKAFKMEGGVRDDGKSYPAKLVVDAQFVVSPGVEEQKDFAGLMHTMRFFVGSDEDPFATKQGTWHRNATQLTELLKDSGVALSVGIKPTGAFMAAAEQRVGGTVKAVKAKKPQYDGQHKIVKFFKLGTKPVRVLDDGGSAAVGVAIETKEFAAQE